MYYALARQTRILKQRECVVVFAAPESGTMAYLHPVYGVLLALCNGERSGEDLTEVLTEAFGFTRQRAGEVVRQLTGDLAAYVTTSTEPKPCRHPYDPVEFVYKPIGDPHLRSLSIPVYVAWLVTERCPFDCVYCCIKTLPARGPADGEMTRDEAARFVEDCVATGVQSMTFHGGEPFLRGDIPDLVKYLRKHNVFVAISTKLALPEAVVARLAEAGLEQMQVSVDTPDPAAADRIVGHPNYLRGALANIDLLQRYGIAVKINTVVTGHNVREVPRLLRMLAERGVRWISLAGYLRSFWKHTDDLLPGREQLVAMAAEVDALLPEFPGITIDMCPLQDPRDKSLSGQGMSACSGGKNGFVVGADGRVSVCDRLLPFEETIVGNVKTESVLDIWNGTRLRAWVDPGDDAFAGTECRGCGMKPECDWRMRCYYRSKMIEGRFFAPDHLCPVVPPPSIRFF